MKVLIVTLYFPPAAGGGVQRPLKFAEHLAKLGVDTFVLAPEDAGWLRRDDTVPEPVGVIVRRIPYVGPANRLRSRELHGLSGVRRLAVEVRNLPRRLLVPDSDVLWNVTAIPAAIKLVRRERIDVVVTSSPPDSLHILGAMVKAATGVRWLADLRDPVIKSPFRRREVRGERLLARFVARNADAVVAATHGVAAEMRELRPAGPVDVIESGCDFDDFEGLSYQPGERLRITHTGNFFARRNPRPFLEALAHSSRNITARFVGDFRASDREYAERLALRNRLELIPFVARREALALQRSSDVLLLLVGDGDGRGRSVITAKLFEYLAAGRPILAASPVDGEAAELIRETGVGTIVAPNDIDGIARALDDFERRWRAGALDPPPLSEELRVRLSRRRAAERLVAVAERIL